VVVFQLMPCQLVILGFAEVQTVCPLMVIAAAVEVWRWATHRGWKVWTADATVAIDQASRAA
jgi:hypothetical protein